MNERLRTTHPFHPLRGQEFEGLDARFSWSKHWLYYADSEGRLSCIPTQWTDQAEPDPVAVIGEGRAHGQVEDLLRLAELVEGLK